MKEKLSLVNLSKKQQEMVKAGSAASDWCKIKLRTCSCYCDGCVPNLKRNSYEEECEGIEN